MILNAEKSMKRILAALTLPLVVSFILTLSTGNVFGQEEQSAVTLTFTTWKYADGTRTLVSGITATDSIGEAPVQGLEIHFFNPSEAGENLIGSINTGANGKAILSIAPSAKLIADNNGIMKFTCRFDGTPKYEASEAEIKVKDARIEMGFAEIDSVRKITYKGVVKNAKGEEQPLANMDVYFYVPRMFSMLKVVDGWLEEDGEGESDFPGDLIGDSTGVVKMYARIEENPDFGNLEAEGATNWAIPKHNEKREGPQRELWTPIAPLWMIITLIIMLTGVWAHYLYAIVQLVLINRAGKKHKEKPT
jgi:hypothetical protein